MPRIGAVIDLYSFFLWEHVVLGLFLEQCCF